MENLYSCRVPNLNNGNAFIIFPLLRKVRKYLKWQHRMTSAAAAELRRLFYFLIFSVLDFFFCQTGSDLRDA